MVKYILSILLVISSTFCFAESKTIETLVVDSVSGSPVVAASVSVRGRATLTNADGRFRMEVCPDDTVRMSCIGYAPVAIEGRNVGGVIRMKTVAHVLPEVTVKSLDVVMQCIIKEQRRQLKRGKKMYANYMYRQTTMQRGKPVSIVEAFFNGRSVIALRDAKLITGRYSEIDMKNGRFSHTANFFPLSQIQLYNPERKLKRWDRILPFMASYKDYYHTSYDIVPYNGRNVYCIDFAPRDTVDETEIFVGKVFVDQNTLSLLAVEGEIRNLHAWQNYGTIKERLTAVAMRFSMSYSTESGYSEVQSVNVTASYGNTTFSSLLYNVGDRKINGGRKLKELRDIRQQIDAAGKDNGFWEANEIVLRTRGERSLLNLGKVSSYVPSTANDRIDSLGVQICNNPQIQEKIYLHCDNQCYYLGDTLWYKAYVMCSDDLRPTDLSRILYVELLTPDGYLVERQQLPIGGDGSACGQFALRDTLYSGYYEVRAYTRWQLNFNVEHREYSSFNRHLFYSKQFERDYFREYPGLYSRVFPVYERPDRAGDYNDRRIVPRPKQSQYSEKLRLHAAFYPEGGTLVDGVPCRVSFEMKDQDGQAVSIEGTVNDSVKIHSDRSGRGEFTIVPDGKKMKAHFNWAGKEYSFRLPESSSSGCTVAYDVLSGILRYETKGVAAAAYSIACRGRVSHFERLVGGTVRNEIDIAGKSLPTGINEVVLYDSTATPIASRQLFVNNHDMGVELATEIRNEEGREVTDTTDVSPYEALHISVTDRNVLQSRLSRFSISVRDTRSDEPSYDDGNVLTDILLSGDLKGFVPYPAYYFASDDAEHRSALDLLLKVQGWRRYKRTEKIRYMPEKRLTYEGVVLKAPDLSSLSMEDYLFNLGHKSMSKGYADGMEQIMEGKAYSYRDIAAYNDGNSFDAGIEQSKDEGYFDDEVQENKDTFDAERMEKETKKRMKKNIVVEAELVKDEQVADIRLTPKEDGHFSFVMPDYYDKAILFVNAWMLKDSLRESLNSRKNSDFALSVSQNLFVKRDWFYPNFVNKYSWYQINEPEKYSVEGNTFDLVNDSIASSVMLGGVYVRKYRKSRRAINPSLPAVRIDAYKLYNDVTDCGLSYGEYGTEFPYQAATYFVGYLDRPTDIKVKAFADGTVYYSANVTVRPDENVRKVNADSICFKKIQNFKMFTDYDKRRGTRLGLGSLRADVTMMIENIPDNGVRPVYSCRRYVMPGYNLAEEFYSPDYSKAQPTAPADYRRTLYWNPNASLDSDGKFSTTIYAGSRPCRVKATVCGIGADGQVYLNKSFTL